MTTGNNGDPQIQELAKRLLGYETTSAESSEDAVSALVRVCDKFRRLLTTLIGALGFRALLERALTLAKAQTPQLHAVRVKPDGSLEEGPPSQGHMAGADVVLIAQFLSLFATFIGKDMMLTLVLGVWPDLPVPEKEFRRNIDHESAK